MNGQSPAMGLPSSSALVERSPPPPHPRLQQPLAGGLSEAGEITRVSLIYAPLRGLRRGHRGSGSGHSKHQTDMAPGFWVCIFFSPAQEVRWADRRGAVLPQYQC